MSYTRLVDGIDGILSALADNNLVAIGSPWYSKWDDTDNEGRLRKIYCWNGIDGGHEYILYGYNQNIEYLEGMNSWGKEWGKNGKMLIPFQAIPIFKRHGGYDAHIINIEWRQNELSNGTHSYYHRLCYAISFHVVVIGAFTDHPGYVTTGVGILTTGLGYVAEIATFCPKLRRL